MQVLCFVGWGAIGPLAQLVEQLTLNQLVRGSSPRWPTNIKARLVPGFVAFVTAVPEKQGI